MPLRPAGRLKKVYGKGFNMKKQILMFSVGGEKNKAVRQICEKLGWSAFEPGKERYGETLGSLLGMPVCAKDSKKSQVLPLHPATGFPAEMIVFCGLDGAERDMFLKEYKKTGIAPIPLKAMLTPYNIGWTAEKLFGELLEEHRRMKNYK